MDQSECHMDLKGSKSITTSINSMCLYVFKAAVDLVRTAPKVSNRVRPTVNLIAPIYVYLIVTHGVIIVDDSIVYAFNPWCT